MKTAPFALTLLFAAPGFWAASAWAAGGAGGEAPVLPSSRLEVAITLYAGGITMGHMDMDATQRGGAYHVVSNLQTSGVINAFWQSEIQATSSGRLGAKNFAPSLYDTSTPAMPARSRKYRCAMTARGRRTFMPSPPMPPPALK